MCSVLIKNLCDNAYRQGLEGVESLNDRAMDGAQRVCLLAPKYTFETHSSKAPIDLRPYVVKRDAGAFFYLIFDLKTLKHR